MTSPAAPAEPAPAEVALVAWFTDRLTINQMTETEALPDFQSKNPGITATLSWSSSRLRTIALVA